MCAIPKLGIINSLCSAVTGDASAKDARMDYMETGHNGNIYIQFVLFWEVERRTKKRKRPQKWKQLQKKDNPKGVTKKQGNHKTKEDPTKVVNPKNKDNPKMTVSPKWS